MSLPPVYSAQFFAVAGLSGSATHFVEPGYVDILTDVWVYWGTKSLDTEFKLIGDNGQTIWPWLFTIASADPSAFWQGRQVITSQFQIQTAGDPLDVSASGYHLSLP